MLDRTQAEASLDERKSWKQRWQDASTFDRVILIFMVIALGVLLVVGASALFSSGKAPAPAARNALVGGTEAELGKTVKRVVDDVTDPRFKKIESAQDALGKRVITLEAPPPAFNYELFYEYASGKKK